MIADLLVGAGIGALLTMIVVKILKRIEYRREMREMCERSTRSRFMSIEHACESLHSEIKAANRATEQCYLDLSRRINEVELAQSKGATSEPTK